MKRRKRKEVVVGCSSSISGFSLTKENDRLFLLGQLVLTLTIGEGGEKKGVGHHRHEVDLIL